MAWTPIDLVVPQYANSAGVPYSGAVLKAYQAGTSTVMTMATDSGGGTTFTSIALNSNGYPSNSGSICIPHVSANYKLALYATQAAADANTPAIWSIDNIVQMVVSGAFSIDDAVSSAVTNVVTATHTTTGTPVAGIGTGIALVTETASGNNETGAVIESITTDVTGLSEDFDLSFKLMAAGAAAAEKLRLTSAGRVYSFTSLDVKRATVVSHATTGDIWSVGNQIDWTGTATTTAFPTAPQAGAERVLVCGGACSFTAGANMLIQGYASGNTVTMAANDIVIVRAISTTQFHLTLELYTGVPAGVVTVAKGGTSLATLAANNVILGNGTSAPSFVAPSTSGNVLTSNGTTWASAAPAQTNVVLLATLTPTAAASVESLNVFTSTYDQYVIRANGLLSAADDVLRMQFAVAGAAETGGVYGDNSGTNAMADGGTSAFTTTYMTVSGSIEATSGDGLNFNMTINNANAASGTIKTMQSHASYHSSDTGYFKGLYGSGGFSGAAITGVKFYWASASNFVAQGTIRIWGIRNS